MTTRFRQGDDDLHLGGRGYSPWLEEVGLASASNRLRLGMFERRGTIDILEAEFLERIFKTLRYFSVICAP